MKKRPSDIEGLVVQLQQQLNGLEKKIDTLIGQSLEKPLERQYSPKPFQRFDHSRGQGEARQDTSYRERVLHKTICADCRKECEVPFKPSGGRPVYCKDCFAKRKANSPFKANTDNRPREEYRPRHRPSYKHERVESHRPYEKKKITRKRKKR